MTNIENESGANRKTKSLIGKMKKELIANFAHWKIMKSASTKQNTTNQKAKSNTEKKKIYKWKTENGNIKNGKSNMDEPKNEKR